MARQEDGMQQLSKSAQEVVALMREESVRYKQPLVGTEHLLLGLMRVPDASTAAIFAYLGATLPRAREAVELLAGTGRRRFVSDEVDLGLTPRTTQVFALAQRLRAVYRHAEVEPEHLLIGLLDVPGNAALGVLQTLGLERGRVRELAVDALRMRLPAAPLSQTEAQAPALTHLDARGQAHMVDVGAKLDTQREAIARGTVLMQPATLRMMTEGNVPKGDVLATARIAGIMAAKRTAELIPLCHPLLLSHVGVELTPDTEQNAVHIEATVRTAGKTGVEMEALTAVSVAALTIYDMCKAADRGMHIVDVRLAEKRGGKSGEIVLE